MIVLNGQVLPPGFGVELELQEHEPTPLLVEPVTLLSPARQVLYLTQRPGKDRKPVRVERLRPGSVVVWREAERALQVVAS